MMEWNAAVNCDLMELGLHDADPLHEAHRGYFGLICKACAMRISYGY